MGFIATEVFTFSEARVTMSLPNGQEENSSDKVEVVSNHVQVFEGEWDEEGVYFYQAFNDKIAEFALENQIFGGPEFRPARMTWIKPSFAWVLYRSGYARKSNQTRILKIKLTHKSVAHILTRCTCFEGGFRGGGTKGACTDGRVQWDPARDILTADKKVPRKMLSRRAIQIGVCRSLSQFYAQNIVSIEDVTALAHKVCKAHRTSKKSAAKALMEQLLPELPVERPYLPCCSDTVLTRLGMLPGKSAISLAGLGRGMVTLAPRPVQAPPRLAGVAVPFEEEVNAEEEPVPQAST